MAAGTEVAYRENTTATKKVMLPVDEKHLKRATMQHDFIPLGLPPVAPHIKRKLSRSHLSRSDHNGIKQQYDAPRPKRRKRFRSMTDSDDSHITLSGKVFIGYDYVESDCDEVFKLDPGTGSSSTTEVINCNSMLSQDAYPPQHTARDCADNMDGYRNMTSVSNSLVVQLISNMQSFTFNGPTKSTALHKQKRKERSS